MARYKEGVAAHELTRRDAFKLTGVAAGAVTVAGMQPSSARSESVGPAQTTPVWNHDPASPIGPNHWGDIGFPTCGAGTEQSPVNISTRATRRLNGPALVTAYHTSELTIENTGHVVEVLVPPGVTDSLRIGNDTYDLVQYHFHAPSEHAVDGHLADLEAHFVHVNEQGQNAVLAAFFRRGHEANRLLTKILFSAPISADDEVTVGEANPAELLPSLRPGGHQSGDVGSFYTYDGSLTTPGCTESVRWFVLPEVRHVRAAALERFHFVISQFPNYEGYPNNNRPVQSLNGRVVGFQPAHHAPPRPPTRPAPVGHR